MRSINSKTLRAAGPATIAATAVVAAAIALNVIVRVVHATPHVGDIVAFTPSVAKPIDDGTRLLVHRQDQFGCVLDLNVLRRSGGSLVVETQLGASANSFRAHWAGPRTSDDAGNCGSEADLIVDHLDLDVLALSAGGYGVGAKTGIPILGDNVNIPN